MTKLKSKKKMLLFAAVGVVAIIAVFWIVSMGSASKVNAEPQTISTMPLIKRPLVNSISASGSVESMTTTSVYSTVSSTVKEIAVEVGDKVSVGDTLALLDDVSLKNQIRQAENSLLSAEDSLDSGLINARTSFENAKAALEKQTVNYNIQKEEYDNGTSSQLLAAQNTTDSSYIAWENALKDVEKKEKDYNSNVRLYEVGAVSKSTLNDSLNAFESAQNTVNTSKSNYEKALVDLNAMKSTVKSNLEIARLDLESAKLNYNNAARTLEQYQSGTSTANGSLENQKLSLETLNQQLDDSTIKSPVNGVVTEKNAVVGGASNGVLFVIEDTKDLYVTVRVKEYNLAKIFIGQKATVTTDATGGKSFNGEVVYISPKAVSAAGDTSVEFEVRVRVLDVDDSLVKIGMNASVNIIIESRDSAYAVLYDSVVTNDEGSFIYIYADGIVKQVAVTTGMKTDMFVEVIGDELTDGMVVISNPSLVTVGQALDESMVKSTMTFVAPNSGDSQTGPGGEGQMYRIQGGGGAMRSEAVIITQ